MARKRSVITDYAFAQGLVVSRLVGAATTTMTTTTTIAIITMIVRTARKQGQHENKDNTTTRITQ
jgi:hypothetical protein